MAQAPAFQSSGGLRVAKGRAYTVADLPTVPTTGITIVKISEAPLIWRKVYDKNGDVEKDEKGLDKYVKGNQRGVWVLISRSGVTYPTGDDVNIPVLYKEDDEIGLHADNSYTFLQPCTVEYGNV